MCQELIKNSLTRKQRSKMFSRFRELIFLFPTIPPKTINVRCCTRYCPEIDRLDSCSLLVNLCRFTILHPQLVVISLDEPESSRVAGASSLQYRHEIFSHWHHLAFIISLRFPANLFVIGIATSTSTVKYVQYFLRRLLRLSARSPVSHKLPIDKIEIWIQNFWCSSLHTERTLSAASVANLLDKMSPTKKFRRAAEWDSRRRQKLLEFALSSCFSSRDD